MYAFVASSDDDDFKIVNLNEIKIEFFKKKKIVIIVMISDRSIISLANHCLIGVRRKN